MTRDEFIEKYAADSGMPRERLDGLLRAEECDCGEEGCHGWKMVSIERDES